jgi:transcriptional regulator with PAS, ATPase and Fis domain
MENEQLREEVTELRTRLEQRIGFETNIGSSEPMERLFERMRLVAPTRSTVLVTGESGTGKELVANAIHFGSPRRGERFLAINCGAIPSDILESELFGHEKGSFTGAVARKVGKFELAHKGTLFLDEISELYPELQVKLLRVLEERKIMRVGGSELIDVDFRLIAATNRDLEKEVAAGRFREDLYYRLKVVTLHIPALRERPSDIPLLADHFLHRFTEDHDKEELSFSKEAVDALSRHAWPGNVRELKNQVESIVVFHPGGEIKLKDLPYELRAGGAVPVTNGRIQPRSGPAKTMSEIERQAILESLERTSGHRAEAAKMLEIGLRTLQRKLKEYRDEGYFQD